jgi:hypothetical protein
MMIDGRAVNDVFVVSNFNYAIGNVNKKSFAMEATSTWWMEKSLVEAMLRNAWYTHLVDTDQYVLVCREDMGRATEL